MKAYLITTGLLFSLITVLHVWKTIGEWPQNGVSIGYLLGIGALIALPAALAFWAFALVRNASNRSKNPQP